MKANPHGASVVPSVAAIAIQQILSSGICGTMELCQTNDQSGLAKMPSMIYSAKVDDTISKMRSTR